MQKYQGISGSNEKARMSWSEEKAHPRERDKWSSGLEGGPRTSVDLLRTSIGISATSVSSQDRWLFLRSPARKHGVLHSSR